MKVKSIITTLLLFVAGLQTAHADHEYVDLFLPSGTLWATCNVGANSPEEFGDYFAWGETVPKDGYTFINYMYCKGMSNEAFEKGSEKTMTKYCPNSDYGYKGFTDELDELLPEDDAATANWGSHWQMPSKVQCEELYNSDNTTQEWTTLKNVNGLLITSKKNGNYIFLPAAGFYNYGGSILSRGSIGSYWSLTLGYPPHCGQSLMFDEYTNIDGWNGRMGGMGRFQGLPVRPVRKQSIPGSVLVTGIILSPISLSLTVGETQTLMATIQPPDAKNKTLRWSSSDERVATVDQTGKVTAVGGGPCTITCSATDGSDVKAECQVTVIKAGYTGLLTCPDNNHPHVIDLGLQSGTKWCCCNVGASTPESYGTYYAWGETTDKSVYNEVTYLYFNGQDTNGDGWIDENFSKVDIGSEIAGTSYDAATFNMDAPWRMPTSTQIKELLECSREWTTLNNVNGILVTGPNGSQIFLPAAGNRGYDNLYNAGCSGHYWSSSISLDSYYANGLYFDPGDCYVSYSYREYGRSVRAVRVVLVTGITLNPALLSLTVGETQILTATILPSNATSKTVKWSSSDESVVTVDQTGKVTAVASGSCTIICTPTDNSGVKGECQVTVTQLVTSISITPQSLSLKVNETKTLKATIEPFYATNQNVTWESKNPNIATVDQNGKVKARAVGDCIITCAATDGSGVEAECQVTVYSGTTSDPDNYEYVDLGLPSGTLWATCNVGANSPEEYGDYFAWGEIELKEEYWRNTYKYYSGDSFDTLTKYCSQSKYGYNGFTDNLTVLEPEDDAARLNWSNNWQMPNDEQFRELINSDYTMTEWTTQSGINGMKITSKINGNYIFLPAAGYRSFDDLNCAGSDGYYWSSALYEINSNDAWCLAFGSGDVTNFPNFRYQGLSIRPVRKHFTVTVAAIPTKGGIVLGGGGYATGITSTILLTATPNTGYEFVAWSDGVTDNPRMVTVTGNVTFTALFKSITTTNWAQKVSLYMGENQKYEYDVPELSDISFDDRKMQLIVNKANNQVDEYSVLLMDRIAFFDDETHAVGGHEYVDLDLPSGTLWATCNVGANNPEEYGEYFAWGETGEIYNSWDNYKYCNGSENTLTKYCTNSDEGYNGFKDDLTVLAPEDDAARINWGNEWQMPSVEQFHELINSEYTTTTWITQNGVSGRMITSKSNGKSVFLPAAGIRFGTSLYDVGSYGNYWSRSLGSSYSNNNACYLNFDSGYIYTYGYSYRYCGQSVRPVRVQN